MAILNLAAYAIFVGGLIAASVTDLRRRVIPNWLVAALAAVWVAWRCTLWLIFGETSGVADSLFAALLFGGGLFMFALLFEGISGKRAMGGGDIKLMAACALFLGLQRSAVCLLLACLTSLPLAKIIPHTRFARPDEARGTLPFGPAIAAGSVIALLL